METEQKVTKSNERVSERNEQNMTLFKLSMRDLSNVTLILPLSGLLFCLITG